MYEEPYRWVEAIENRRQYLKDQLKKGTPIVSLSCGDGILVLTFNRGTLKLYEIYDRIAFGGIGHPADLEKLRFQLLDLAHVEGFKRSPSDVTGSRLVKYGIAPVVKDAFEEVFKAPYISKVLICELKSRPDSDHFVRLGYDGAFDESSELAIAAATSEIESTMEQYLKGSLKETTLDLNSVFLSALFTWAVGGLCQAEDASQSNLSDPSKYPDEKNIIEYLEMSMRDMSLECVFLNRTASQTSQYREIYRDELVTLLPKSLQYLIK